MGLSPEPVTLDSKPDGAGRGGPFFLSRARRVARDGGATVLGAPHRERLGQAPAESATAGQAGAAGDHVCSRNFDYPADHWKHLRTTNLIESTFATVRLREGVTKGAG